jgi:hypothetical protein
VPGAGSIFVFFIVFGGVKLDSSTLEELQQVAVDEIGMRGRKAVGKAGIVDFNRALDQPS